MPGRSLAVLILSTLVLAASSGCSIKVPPEVAAELTPPDGQRPNNYEVQEEFEDEVESRS